MNKKSIISKTFNYINDPDRNLIVDVKIHNVEHWWGPYYIAKFNFIENGVVDPEIHDGGIYVEGNEWWLFHSVEEAKCFEKSYAIVHSILDPPTTSSKSVVSSPPKLQTFEIDGSTYTQEKLIDILRKQIPGLKKYSHFADASIEFCSENKEGEIFFYVAKDDEDMMVKIGQDGNIYWDWTGPVLG